MHYDFSCPVEFSLECFFCFIFTLIFMLTYGGALHSILLQEKHKILGDVYYMVAVSFFVYPSFPSLPAQIYFCREFSMLVTEYLYNFVCLHNVLPIYGLSPLSLSLTMSLTHHGFILLRYKTVLNTNSINMFYFILSTEL
jgi:hypothetical protein